MFLVEGSAETVSRLTGCCCSSSESLCVPYGCFSTIGTWTGKQDVTLHRPVEGGAGKFHGSQNGEGHRGVLGPGHALQLQGTVS